MKRDFRSTGSFGSGMVFDNRSKSISDVLFELSSGDGTSWSLLSRMKNRDIPAQVGSPMRAREQRRNGLS